MPTRPRLADTLRNRAAAYDLLFRTCGINQESIDHNSDSPEYEAANEAAISVLTDAYADLPSVEADEVSIPEVPDVFGDEIGSEVQSLLVMAFLRSPRLAETLTRPRIYAVADIGQRVWPTVLGVNDCLDPAFEWEVVSIEINKYSPAPRYTIIGTEPSGPRIRQYSVPETHITPVRPGR
jgi:hypothetical protein